MPFFSFLPQKKHSNYFFKPLIRLLFLIFVKILSNSFLLSQTIPNGFFDKKQKQILFDSGYDWHSLTILGPETDYNFHGNTKEINSEFKIGNQFNNSSFLFFLYTRFSFKNKFYGTFFPRFSKNLELFPRFPSYQTKHGKEIYRIFDIDLSGITFHQDWVTIQIGRGRESWGAGNNIQLALSETSSPYDYLMLKSDYGKIRVKYIHGFLEKVFNDKNRFVVARGIEYTNKKSLVIGLSETVIYSGKSRSFDISYLNPIGSHLESELNNRSNFFGASSANGVWQFHLDHLFKNRFRLSWNFLIDEFVLDKKKEPNKQNSTASSTRILFSIIKSKQNILNFSLKHIYAGSFTFSHWVGENNFVQSNIPLGWENGSDAESYGIEIDHIYKDIIISTLNIGRLKSGEKNIKDNPYMPYVGYEKQKFPTGTVSQFDLVYLQTFYKMTSKLSFSFELMLKTNTLSNKRIVEMLFGINKTI